jgi:integrase
MMPVMECSQVPYLFKRKGSDNYYVRLQPPGQKLIERSLGTSDLKAAELAAADVINQHKAFMYQRRQARVARVVHGPWTHEHAPGLHTLPGGHVLATETTLTFTDAAGKITSTRPNGGPMIYLTGAPLSTAQTFKALDDAWEGRIGEGPVGDDRPKFVAAKTSADDALLEDYIKFGSIKKKNGRGGKPLNPTREKEARKIWATFKQIVQKPLKDCTYDDGVALVAHIEAEHQKRHGEPIKAATVQRTLVPLIALVTRAQVLKKFTGVNPFLHVGSNGAASDIVDEYSDADLALIRKHLDKLSKEDQLLLRVACATGMDRGELFGIKSEATEDGIRYCTVARGKTEARPRRVPFPTALLKHKDFPKRIDKQLFTNPADSTTKRLTKFLESIGIVMDKGVGEDGQRHILHALHSFRHRARSRLRRAYPAGDELAYAVGGWTLGKRNSGWDYGKFPLRTLKEAIDTIGGL